MNINGHNIPKILFIKSVFIKDCVSIDDIFEQQIIDQLQVDMPVTQYTTLPSTFYSVDTWIKKTNIACWYCDLNFDCVPVFIPGSIDTGIGDNMHHISTYGCFCSFSCAISHNNIYNQKICQNIKVRDMILYLYSIFNNNSVRNIPQSPNKYSMKKYGGTDDPSVFRNAINSIKESLLLKHDRGK